MRQGGRGVVGIGGSLVLALVLHLIGCTQGSAGPRTAPPDGAELPILWEASGTWSNLARPVRIVAYDQATLDQAAPVPVPVDFSRQMVLIAGLGPTVGQDLGIRIVRVWREGSRLRVQERRLHPGAERPADLHRSSPWTVVVVPRCELNVEGYSSRVPPGVRSDGPP